MTLIKIDQIDNGYIELEKTNAGNIVMCDETGDQLLIYRDSVHKIIEWLSQYIKTN